MSENEGEAATPDEAEIEHELEQVRAERNGLRAKVDALEARPQRRRRLRRILAPILVALAVVIFTVAVPAAWGARTVLNTDRYVATVGPLADDPAVQASIAAKLTDQVFAALDVQEVLADALSQLGERAPLLAAPLTSAMRGFVQGQVENVVASEAFASFWREANRFVHEQVLAILRGDSEAVSVLEGRVLLNLLPLVTLALASIQSVASDLVGRDVTLPQVTADEIPAQAIAEVEQALGVDLPDDYAQIPVYESQDLEALQRTLYAFERLLVLLLILFPILVAASLWISTRRRRTLIQLAAGSAVGLVLVRRGAILARDSLFDRLDTQDFPAVRVLTEELMASLFRYTGILLTVALLTLAIALITGPYPWAVRLRVWVRDTAKGLAAMLGGGPVTETDRVRWVREHRDGLMVGGAIVAVVLFLLVDLSFLMFVVVAVVIALYEIALIRLGREAPGAETA